MNKYVVNNLYWLVAGNGMLTINYFVYNHPVPVITCFGWGVIIWSGIRLGWYLKTRQIPKSKPRTVTECCFDLFTIVCIPVIEYMLIGKVEHLIQSVTLVLLAYELIQLYFVYLKQCRR